MATTIAYVVALPDCDYHKMQGKHVPARYDGATHQGPWANMCGDCFALHGVGLGLGVGQALEVVSTDNEAERNKAHEISNALAIGDYERAEEIIGDGDIFEYL